MLYLQNEIWVVEKYSKKVVKYLPRKYLGHFLYNNCFLKFAFVQILSYNRMFLKWNRKICSKSFCTPLKLTKIKFSSNSRKNWFWLIKMISSKLWLRCAHVTFETTTVSWSKLRPKSRNWGDFLLPFKMRFKPKF